MPVDLALFLGPLVHVKQTALIIRPASREVRAHFAIGVSVIPGRNDVGNEDEQSQLTDASSSGDERAAANDPEGATNTNDSSESSRRRTASRLWRNLFGFNATVSRSDAAANAINNEGNTLEEPLLPDV